MRKNSFAGPGRNARRADIRRRAHNLTLMRELAAKVLKAGSPNGTISSKRGGWALDPALRTQIARLILHGFGV